VERRKKKSEGQFINNYKIKKLLGEGSFGKVKLCEDFLTGKLYALKQISKT
jgi:serine/threonine protein kinase